jgi:hypothetical protein
LYSKSNVCAPREQRQREEELSITIILQAKVA